MASTVSRLRQTEVYLLSNLRGSYGGFVAVRVTIVHSDQDIAEAVGGAVRQNGHEVTCFTDPMAALPFIEDARRSFALIACVRFGPGRVHGIALGLMARRQRAGTKILFMSEPEDAELAREVGSVISAAASAAEVARALEQLLLSG
jgi:DNA-binding NtrC family response regulator